MILRKFKLNDLDVFSQFVALDKHTKDVLYSSINVENAFTLEHDGQTIACAGVMIIFPSVGSACGWGYFSKLIHKYPIATHKCMIKGLSYFEKKHGLKRIQADCVKGFDRAVKWLEHLGFEYEGEMRRYGPNGETMLRFGRVS